MAADLHAQIAALDYDLAERITTLEERLKKVERLASRMRLAEADLLRLQPDDVLAVRIPRPLATSESEALRIGFAELMASLGHAHDIKVAIICGHDRVELDVIRSVA